MPAILADSQGRHWPTVCRFVFVFFCFFWAFLALRCPPLKGQTRAPADGHWHVVTVLPFTEYFFFAERPHSAAGMRSDRSLGRRRLGRNHNRSDRMVRFNQATSQLVACRTTKKNTQKTNKGMRTVNARNENTVPTLLARDWFITRLPPFSHLDTPTLR